MDNKIEDFIQRRFPIDNNWLNGNCYFFAVILRAAFGGKIIYNPIDGHFLLYVDGGYYDWSGLRTYSQSEINTFVDWENYHLKDISHWHHIVRDCIL